MAVVQCWAGQVGVAAVVDYDGDDDGEDGQGKRRGGGGIPLISLATASS